MLNAFEDYTMEIHVLGNMKVAARTGGGNEVRARRRQVLFNKIIWNGMPVPVLVPGHYL
jgi:hypothetical protein